VNVMKLKTGKCSDKLKLKDGFVTRSTLNVFFNFGARDEALVLYHLSHYFNIDDAVKYRE